MLLLGGKGKRPDGHAAARTMAEKALDTGAAWEKFRQMVIAQGGDVSAVDDPARLDVAKEAEILVAPRSGSVGPMDCREIGNAAVVLGAGRACVTDTIDPGVGLEMLVRLGDKVTAGDPLVRILHRGGKRLEDCKARLAKAIAISGEPVAVPPLIKQRL
jgi:pyrimidine-nucleoside phosphorylase